jgi:hypothetical protein
MYRSRFVILSSSCCVKVVHVTATPLVRELQPYYAVADFNGDGREDFAVAFVNDTARARRFAIAIFNGPFARGRQVANFYRAGVDLSDGGLIVSGNRSLAGTFQSDNCVFLSPRGRSYVMRSCV